MNMTCPVIIGRPSLAKGTDRANNCEDSDDEGAGGLPSGQSDTSGNLNLFSVPIEMIVFVDAE